MFTVRAARSLVTHARVGGVSGFRAAPVHNGLSVLARTSTTVAARGIARRSIAPVARRVPRGVTIRTAATAAQGGGGAAVDAYAPALQYLHWFMAAGIIGCCISVNIAMRTKDMPTKGKIMFWHKSFGLLMGGAIVARIGAAIITRRPAAVPGPVYEQLAGKLTHAALYGFMIFMPVSGIVMGYYSGKGLPFFATTIPGKTENREPSDGATAKQAYLLHKQVGYIMEWVIGAHVGAVIFHATRGQMIMNRILPGKSAAPTL